MTEEQKKLVEENMNLVYFTLSRYYPWLLQDEDVRSVGMIGLMLAAQKWEPSRGKFSTFAVKVIKREISNEWRKTQTKGRDEKTNRYYECAQKAAQFVGREQNTNDVGDLSIWNLLASPEDVAKECEERIDLQKALAKLPPRHVEILKLHYVEKMKLDDIGELYGMSRQRAHEIICTAKRHLLHELGESYKE